MKRKQLSEVGRFKVGQRVRYVRPDRRTPYGSEREYLEDVGVISAICTCESGALITITSEGCEMVAHVHIGIHEMKPIAYVCTSERITVLHDAPRQMEIAA